MMKQGIRAHLERGAMAEPKASVGDRVRFHLQSRLEQFQFFENLVLLDLGHLVLELFAVNLLKRPGASVRDRYLTLSKVGNRSGAG